MQARSTSTRFPDKVSAEIEGKTMLEHVLAACFSAAKYVNRNSSRSGIFTTVALLVPTGDKLAEKYQSKMAVVEGDELDVLDRYYKAATALRADFVVRITSDCPLMTPYLISKAINVLVKNRHHFVTNAMPKTRTFLDGVDVEAMTYSALKWAHENTKEQREHVTIDLYDPEKTPEWFSVGVLMAYVDLSTVKLSVDTKEDLKRVQAMYKKIDDKIKQSEALYGKGCVYRF